MSKREYSGEPIDASWQTPPWQNDGETLDAYDSEGEGETMTVDWPENATDPEKVSDKQRKIILTAARYPNVNESKKLHELAGIDGSPWYVNKTLGTHWSERYWVDSPVSKDSDEDGKTMTADWPENATDPDELNDKQKKMILTAVNHPDVNSPTQLVELSGLDVSKHYPNYVLRQFWPERYWCKTADTDPSEGQHSLNATVEEIRERALNGETAVEIAQSLGITSRPIRRRLHGRYGFGEDSDIPELEYDPSAQEWYIPEDTEGENQTPDDTEEESATTPKSDTPTPATPEPARDGTPAWVWAALVVVGAWIVSKVFCNA